MKTIQNTAAGFFIAAVAVLTAVSTLGVWDFFSKDVISKSFQTLGLLAVVAIIIMIAGNYMNHPSDASPLVPEIPNPIFNSLRILTLIILIVSGSLLALLGILSIWEVIQDKELLYKSLSSLAIIAFGAFLIVITCLDREGKLKHEGKSTNVSLSGVVLLMLIVGGWILNLVF